MPLVLLAEDDPQNVEIMTRLLRRQGFEVLVARDGGEAVLHAEAHLPQLIIMDMGLPVLSGWDATRRIRLGEKTRHIPIIACTAAAMPNEREQARQAGCNDFQSKPVMDFGELLAKIRRLLPPDPPAPMQASP